MPRNKVANIPSPINVIATRPRVSRVPVPAPGRNVSIALECLGAGKCEQRQEQEAEHEHDEEHAAPDALLEDVACDDKRGAHASEPSTPPSDTASR